MRQQYLKKREMESNGYFLFLTKSAIAFNYLICPRFSLDSRVFKASNLLSCLGYCASVALKSKERALQPFVNRCLFLSKQYTPLEYLLHQAFCEWTVFVFSQETFTAL